MKTLKIYSIIFVLTIAFVFTACDQWLDVNKSVDNPTSITVDQSLPVIVFYASQICYDHAEYGMYLSQALTTGGRSQTSAYAYKSGWEMLSMNRHPQWRRHFYDIGVNVNSLIDEAEKIDSKNFILIARSIRLHSTLLTTDAFGDMPHSQVYKSNSPTYDKQEDIYNWMNQEVNELIALYDDPAWVSNPNNKVITKKMDRIFEGDLGKWRAFTKALKARIMLRKLPNWDNTPETCDNIIAAVDAALTDPSYQDALYRYDGGSTEKNSPWGSAQPKLNLGWAQGRENLLTEAIPSKFLGYALLGAYPNIRTSRGYALDPRAVELMTPRIDDKSLQILRYLDNNIGMATSMKVTYYPDLFAGSGKNPYSKNNGYIMLMSQEELMFMKAEAQYWKGEKAAAYTTTVAATKKNMERVGVTTENATKLTYFNKFFEIKLPGEALFTIADLMQQKYVAMYMQPEMWTDVRRYNYSSKANGIAYDGIFVYTVSNCHDGTNGVAASNYKLEYSLTRPFNLYEAYWNTADCYGTNAKLSPNAWITRLNYDPETEDKYNRKELERLGAYKNPEWLKKRMIWAYKNNSKVTANDNTEWK
ncbi:MAG: SusD/RagB family nutrient-binding outer membrane lipoprotein [Paludibacter sp.]